MRVWAIYYTVRRNSSDKWDKDWTGPCGVYLMGDGFNTYQRDCLQGRPFFFRTRALARQKAKELNKERNANWKWVKYIVRPIELTYKELKN